MQEKDTTKGRAKVCLDSTGVSGLPFCMFCTKHHVRWCCRAQPSIFQLNGANVLSLCCLNSSSIVQLSGAKVSSSVSFSCLVDHIKLMFVGVVEFSRAYFS